MSRKWTAGDEYDAGSLNVEVVDLLQSFIRPAEVWVERGLTTQNFAAQTAGPYPMDALVWDTARKDPLGAWDQSDKSVINVPLDGWWDIIYGISWAANATTTANFSVALSVNGTLASDHSSTYLSPSELTRGDTRLVTTGSTIAAYRRKHSAFLRKDDTLRMRASIYAATNTRTEFAYRPNLRMVWTSQ